MMQSLSIRVRETTKTTSAALDRRGALQNLVLQRSTAVMSDTSRFSWFLARQEVDLSPLDLFLYFEYSLIPFRLCALNSTPSGCLTGLNTCTRFNQDYYV